MFIVEIETINNAFQEEDDCREELARILTRIAARLRDGQATRLLKLRDTNGNACGRRL